MEKSNNLDKEILRLSVPAVITNITVPLLALSDTTISGHLGNMIFLGAISAGTMMFNSAFWLFGFLRMGTAGLTAQAFGQKDTVKIRTIFSQSFLMAIICGLFLFLLHVPAGELLAYIISPSEDVKSLALKYFTVTMGCAPAVLAIMAVNGWFFGMQTSLYPMIISIFTNILNIILSLIFVFHTEMGFIGVAWGTAIANWSGLILACILAIRFKGNRYLIADLKEISDFRILKRFFKVNTDIFFRSACIMAVSLAVTAFGARQGNLTLATNAVMMQFFILFSYFMDGIAFTAEALCGRYSGAGDTIMLRKSVRKLFIWGAAIMVVFFLIYLTAHSEIAGLITTDIEVRRNVENYSIWLILIPPLTVLAFIFDGIFIGLTATRSMLAATFFAACVFFAVSLCHPQSRDLWGYPDNNLLWTAFLSYLLARGLILAILTPKAMSLRHLSSTDKSN